MAGDTAQVELALAYAAAARAEKAVQKLRARALAAGEIGSPDPANQPGGVSFAEWDRG